MTYRFKQWSVISLLIASSILVGLLWTYIPQHPYYAFSLLLNAVAWIVFILSANDNRIQYLIAIIPMVLIGFVLGLNKWIFIGVAIASLFTLWALYEARRERTLLLKISVKTMSAKSLRIYFTALTILFSFAYFGAVSTSPNPAKLLLPEDVFTIAFRIAQGPLQTLAPGITPENTVDEAIALALREQLKQNPQTRSEQIPSLAEIKKAIPPQRREIIQNINKQLGTSININTPGTAKISSVLYGVSTQKIESYTKQFSTFVPLLVTIGFFLSLKTLSVLFGYTAILLATFLFKILIGLGILKVEKIPAEQEKIV